jgi:hypothetical protein
MILSSVEPGDVFLVRERTDLSRPKIRFVTAFSNLQKGTRFEGIPSTEVPALNPETNRAFRPTEALVWARTYALPCLMYTNNVDNVEIAIGRQPPRVIGDLQRRALDGLIAREKKIGSIETIRGIFPLGIGYQCLFDNGRPGIIAAIGGSMENPTEIKVILSDDNKKFLHLYDDQRFSFRDLRLKLITPDRLDEVAPKPKNIEQVMLALRGRITRSGGFPPSPVSVIEGPNPPL